jgi:protein TonB
MVETDVLPDDLVVLDHVPIVPVPETSQQGGTETYLSQAKISVLPKLPDDIIGKAMIYPTIALRSGIEGMVYLELYINRYGEIREISIL